MKLVLIQEMEIHRPFNAGVMRLSLELFWSMVISLCQN
jgi:hypothetical protein